MERIYYVINEKGQTVEEFDTMQEAEEYVEYTRQWNHDYYIEMGELYL